MLFSFKKRKIKNGKIILLAAGLLAVAVILTVITAAGLNRGNLSNFSRAAETDLIAFWNGQITRLADSYKTASVSRKLSLARSARAIAKYRNVLLRDELKSNPSALLSHALPIETVNTFPANVRDLFEKKVTSVGNPRVFFSDNFRTGEYRNSIQVAFNRNEKPDFYNLVFVREPAEKINALSRISGVLFDRSLVVSQISQDATFAPTSSVMVRSRETAAPRNPPTGNQHTLVIMFKFASEPNPAYPLPDKTTVNGRIFTDASSANRYLQEVSYNNLSIYGEITDVLTISSSRDNCNTSYESWGTAADAAARAAGYSPDTANYKRIIYLFPYQPGCSFAGISVTDTNSSVVNNKIFLNGNTDGSVVTHEVMHNLELVNETWKFVNHAYSLNCGAKSIDSFANCSEVSGQNQYDLMNTLAYDANPEHVSSALKYNLGWLPAPKSQDVTAPGTYQLDPLETNTSALKSLRIARTDPARGSTEYYFIDYRMPLLFDNQTFFQNTQSQGVVINLWTSDPNSNPLLRIRSPYLIDATPGDGSFTNASLKVGGTFTDSTNPNRIITVTRLADVSGKAQLQVSFSGGPTVPPTGIPPTPIPSLGGVDESKVNCDSFTPSWRINSVVPAYQTNGTTGLTINGSFPHIGYCLSKNRQGTQYGPNWTAVTSKGGLDDYLKGTEQKLYSLNTSAEIASYSESRIVLAPKYSYSNGSDWSVWIAYCTTPPPEYPMEAPRICSGGSFAWIKAAFTINNSGPAVSPTFIPSPRWTFNLQPVCPNGTVTQGAGQNLQSHYIVWPTLGWVPGTPQYTVFDAYFPGVHRITIKPDPAVYDPSAGIFIAMTTPDGKTLNTVGSPPHSTMIYGESFCYDSACASPRPWYASFHWNTFTTSDGSTTIQPLPNGEYTIKFQAPAAWCL